MWASTSLRALLAGLLAVSAVLFAVGSTIERHQHHSESPAAAHHESSGESSESSVEGNTATETHGESGVKVLGVDTESVGLEIAAIVSSLVLAAATLFVRRPVVWLAVVAFGLVFAVGDVRELAHQISESHAGLATIAAVLVVLHLAIAGIAAVLLARRTGPGLAAPDPAN